MVFHGKTDLPVIGDGQGTHLYLFILILFQGKRFKGRAGGQAQEAAFNAAFFQPALYLVIIAKKKLILNVRVYLRIYFAGYPFLLVYDFGSAILRAKGDSRRPFAALAASGILGTCLLRIVWSFTVFEHFGTLESLYFVFPVS